MTKHTLRRACGQLLSVGFDGQAPPPELLARIGRSEVGGVMLFRPNVAGGPGQVAALVRRLRDAGPPDAPLVVAVDQEGGPVQRLRAPCTEWPDMLSVGAAGDPARTERVGRALGSELAALGIGWDFAPVLDVHTNPANPVIGGRAFGVTPAAAAQALAFWRGLRAAGVLGCGKHYPGHGDTRTDSHLDLPVVAHDQDRLRAVELAPFAAAARAGIEALMTAHVSYPALDPDRPATLSRRILTDVLREELGFRGLVVSDDLGMRAVADRWPIEELAVEGLLAGIDHFLVREPEARQAAAFEALVRAAESRSDVRARVEESAARTATFKALLGAPMPLEGEALLARLGTAEHRALAASFARVDAGAAAASSPVVD